MCSISLIVNVKGHLLAYFVNSPRCLHRDKTPTIHITIDKPNLEIDKIKVECNFVDGRVPIDHQRNNF